MFDRCVPVHVTSAPAGLDADFGAQVVTVAAEAVVVSDNLGVRAPVEALADLALDLGAAAMHLVAEGRERLVLLDVVAVAELGLPALAVPLRVPAQVEQPFLAVVAVEVLVVVALELF